MPLRFWGVPQKTTGTVLGPSPWFCIVEIGPKLTSSLKTDHPQAVDEGAGQRFLL